MFSIAPNSKNTLRGGVPMRVPKGTLDAVVDGWLELDSNSNDPFRPAKYFFSKRWFVSFDPHMRRVTPQSFRLLREWNLPGAFSEGVDAVINDAGAAGRFKTYFFKGSEYAVYDWRAKAAGPARPLSELGFSGEFAEGFDSAINGRCASAGKAFFFKRHRCVRFDWGRRKVDQEPGEINHIWTDFDAFRLHAPMTLGMGSVYIAAAENDADIGVAFMCVRKRAVDVDTTLDICRSAHWDRGMFSFDGDTVRERYPGVIEVLQVADASTTVAAWIDAARSALAQLTVSPLTRQALAKHFHVNAENEAALLPVIRANYVKLSQAHGSLSDRLQFATTAEARKIIYKNSDGTQGNYQNAPMWASFGGPIVVNQGTPEANFVGFGPMCKASMVLHELLHHVDADSAKRENHHYEHSKEYAHQSAAQAVHNASSYTCFAQYIYYQQDMMYGAGRPAL